MRLRIEYERTPPISVTDASGLLEYARTAVLGSRHRNRIAVARELRDCVALLSRRALNLPAAIALPQSMWALFRSISPKGDGATWRPFLTKFPEPVAVARLDDEQARTMARRLAENQTSDFARLAASKHQNHNSRAAAVRRAVFKEERRLLREWKTRHVESEAAVRLVRKYFGVPHADGR
jgi:hypothetical protein